MKQILRILSRARNTKAVVQALTCSAVLVLSFSSFSQEAQPSRSDQRGIFGAGQPGEVSVVRMEAKRLGLKNFQMQSRSANGRLAIDGFTANWGSGTIRGTGLADWSRPNDWQRMRLEFAGVETELILKAFEVKLAASVTAFSSGAIDVQWQGVRGAAPRQTMQGTVAIQFSPGTVSNAEVLNQAASITGIAELQRLDFQAGQLEGKITGGLMDISAISFYGPAQQAVGKGALDLRTEEIKVRFHGSVSPSLVQRSINPNIQKIPAAGTKTKGKAATGLIQIPIPVVMSGSIRDPQFTFETGIGRR